MTQAELQASLDAIWGKLTPEAQTELRSQYSSASDGIRTGFGTLEEQRQSLEQQQEQLQSQQSALDEWRKQLRSWATTKEAEIRAREAELGNRRPEPANGGTPPPATPPATAPGAITEDYLGRTLQNFGRDVVANSAELFRLQARHQQLYGNERVFDPEELFKHPHVLEIGLSKAFEDLHKDRIAAAATKAREEAEAKIRADERQKVMSELGNNKALPFPTPGEDDSPMGILQRRQQGEEKEAFGVEAAVAEYRRMRAGIPA